MRKIIIGGYNASTVLEKDVANDSPVFAKKDDILCGMVVKEGGGWIIRVGGAYGANGHHATRGQCITAGMSFGYKFYTK